MDEVIELLNNPLIKSGLMTVAPELGAAVTFLSDIVLPNDNSEIVKIIDNRLAVVLKYLATAKSNHLIEEYEIRAHELLHLLFTWEKTSS